MPSTTQAPPRWIPFAFFFVSGFCGLVYQVIWTRLAFASFGIITPVLSVVISVFMLGLAIGSWAAGRWVGPLVKKTGLSAAMFYAAVEFVIGVGAFAVPRLFPMGERLLLSTGETNSFSYLLLSALALGIAILPWCICMGATFPLMMAYIRETYENATDSFSYLYAANVFGAVTGAFLSAVVFIEMFGFESTLRLAAGGNFAIALGSAFLGSRRIRPKEAAAQNEAPAPPIESTNHRLTKWILFSTGFSAMAMEVVWTRYFAPVLKTQVYSFALILCFYLGATLAGSLLYRHHRKRGGVWGLPTLMAFLAVAIFLPVLLCDPRVVHMDALPKLLIPGAVVVLASICPICGLLGYVTPSLIDSFSAGNPAQAGQAYAINVLGCILGPLIASYALLPYLNERWALFLLSLPFLSFYFCFWKMLPLRPRLASGLATTVLAVYCLSFSRGFADYLRPLSTRIEERRDYAASVISTDVSGEKGLLVNGMGMTELTPITKFMVDLPLAYHNGPCQSALVICFGMGTSYRTALSCNLDTTAVELVPDVPKAFGFYHADAAEVLKNPRGRIVIDDGRRFLNRTREKYDVVVADPPPPLEAAGSSLLYSTQFYELVKQHLNPHAIVQMWCPGGERMAVLGVVRSAYDSFPYVRCFASVEGWGVHILCSMEPIEKRTPQQLAGALPPAAIKDLLEWTPGMDAPSYFGQLKEFRMEHLLNPNPDIKITDDDPLNEYFLMRHFLKQ